MDKGASLRNGITATSSALGVVREAAGAVTRELSMRSESMTVRAVGEAARGLSILYIGESSGTSLHRSEALKRLGHRVLLVDPYSLLPSVPFARQWVDKTGTLLLGDLLQRRVLKEIGAGRFDLVWIDSGNLVNAGLVKELKRRYGTVVNYNVDDPYGMRDGPKWRLYLQSVPFYDLVAVVRECNVDEAIGRGAKNVMFVHRSADEVAHAPWELNSEEQQRWRSQVAFIGTWMPERGPLLVRLVELGVPLTIYGNRWDRAKEWPRLKSHWRGPALEDDREYGAAVQGAAVCLGLLSKGNRDLSTTRSFEIPHLGGTFCAERTSEHLSLYVDGEEASFWSSPEECAEQCGQLLKDEEWRKSLAKAGQSRCLRNGTTNELILGRILDRVAAESRAELVVQG